MGESPDRCYPINGMKPQATAAVTQAHVRLDATERVVASAQLEVSRADDDAQRVHAELDRNRRSTIIKEFS